jgi:hypothetical protein
MRKVESEKRRLLHQLTSKEQAVVERWIVLVVEVEACNVGRVCGPPSLLPPPPPLLLLSFALRKEGLDP